MWAPKSDPIDDRGGRATYSALGNTAQILSTNESERSRDGEDGSLETHLDYMVMVCSWNIFDIERRTVVRIMSK